MPSATGALSGAGTGAAIGSFGGPIGAGIGAGIGGLVGLFGGGKSKEQKEAEAWQKQIAQQQLGIANEQAARERESYAKMLEYLAPLITRSKALAGGNRYEMLASTADERGAFSRAIQGSEQDMLNRMAPGAARDKALQDLRTQGYLAQAGAQAGAVRQAHGDLGNIAQLFQQQSNTSLGSTLAALQGAGYGSDAVMRDATQRRAGTLSFFGNLARTLPGLMPQKSNAPKNDPYAMYDAWGNGANAWANTQNGLFGG